MQYEELLSNLSKNENFRIYDNNYSPQHFGNFNIEFYYKSKIRLRILNDRNIIEVFLIYHSFFYSDDIPLGFAIDFLENGTNKNKIYTFSSISDVYLFLVNSTVYLDEIIEKDLLKNISKAFRSTQGTVPW